MHLNLAMWKWIGPLIIFIIIIENNLLNFLATLSADLHYSCLLRTPASSNYQLFYQALVCGSNPNAELALASLKNLGLYHLVVVSGSHLVFLEAIIAFLILNISRVVRSLRLFSYCSHIHQILEITVIGLLFYFSAVCLFQPPVIRSFFSLLTRRIDNDARLNWPPDYIVLFSGLLSLIHSPHWIHSLSLQLSWMAALIITCRGLGSLQKCLLIFIVLLPVLACFSTSTPMTILTNFALAPLFGFLLFPISLLGVLIPSIWWLFEPLWKTLDHFIQMIDPSDAIANTHLAPNTICVWAYIAFLHLTFIISRKTYHQLRRQNHSRLTR